MGPAVMGPAAAGGGGGRWDLAGLEGLLAVEVVDLALRGVGEDVVGLGDLLELGLGLALAGAGVLVRVPYHGQPPVGLLQVVVARVPVHFQYVVVIHPHVPVHSLSLSKKEMAVVIWRAEGGGGNGYWKKFDLMCEMMMREREEILLCVRDSGFWKRLVAGLYGNKSFKAIPSSVKILSGPVQFGPLWASNWSIIVIEPIYFVKFIE